MPDLYADVKEPAGLLKSPTQSGSGDSRPPLPSGNLAACPPARVVIVGAVGLTGLEPVTLRLSSACSNQLSYRPFRGPAARNLKSQISNPSTGGSLWR
jgi:hypothetical protein